MQPTIEFEINGVPAIAKQYIGIGALNVLTVRGEVKAQTTDFIVEFPRTGVTIVLPAEILMALVEERADRPLTAEERDSFFKSNEEPEPTSEPSSEPMSSVAPSSSSGSSSGSKSFEDELKSIGS